MKIALIGDVHGFWDEFDNEYFNSSDYDYVLFTGDLRPYYQTKETRVARRLASLTKAAFVIPGNADTSNIYQAAGEVFNKQILIDKFAKNQGKKFDLLKSALGKVRLTAYESHTLTSSRLSLDLIVLRPFAMGVKLSYAPILKDRFNIHSMEDSKERIKSLIDSSTENKILFLGHNGPTGLGSEETSLWSSDFTKKPRDWGDEDYRFAINYAAQRGKQVVAAIAGHIHHRIRKKKTNRNWHKEIENIHYVNAAKVPRVFKKDGETFHHHICLEVNEANAIVTEVLVRSKKL